jgi:hypothetical protein
MARMLSPGMRSFFERVGNAKRFRDAAFLTGAGLLMTAALHALLRGAYVTAASFGLIAASQALAFLLIKRGDSQCVRPTASPPTAEPTHRQN